MADPDVLARVAIEALPAAVYMTDAEGRITFYNEAAAALWGCRPELGQSTFCGSWKLYWPDGTPLPHDECPMAMALRQKRPIRGMEAIAERPDGTRLPFVPYPTPLFDNTGTLTGAVNMLVDIRERKRAEEALAEREAQLAVFVEHAPAAIVMFDRKMRYLAVSRRFVVDYLPPGTQLIGRSHYEAFPNIPQRWRDIHARVLAGEALSQHQDQYTHYDGRTDWVRWSMVPWRRANGDVGGALLFAEIITEQVEARRALAESEERLRLAGKAGLVGTFAYDTDTEIMQISEGYVAIHGFPEGTAEIPRSTCLAGVHSEDIERVQQHRDEAFCKGSCDYSIEYRIIRPGGEVRWVETRSFISYCNEGRPRRVIGVSIDVTERKQSELRLAERNTQIELASKTARVGSLAIDFHSGLVKLSPGCATIFGLPEGTLEMSRADGNKLIHPDDLTSVELRRDQALLNQQREITAQFRIRRADDGEVRWIEARSVIFYDQGGKPAQMIGVRIDVTDRKLAADMLTERNLQLELAGKSGLVGTYAYDTEDDEEKAKISPGYAAIHGLPEGTAEITRSVWLASVHPEDAGRLHVRRSQALQNRQREYHVDYRIFRAGEVRWIESRRFISYNSDGCAQRVIGVDIDITERKRAEERQCMLIAELDHRVKNALATVTSVVSQTAVGNRSMADFVAALDGRIRSMATTQELLSSSRWQGISLAELIRHELAPYATPHNAKTSGPEVLLHPEAGRAIAMVLHELATNAAKYGALSTRTGRVSIHWHLRMNGQPQSSLVLEWQEMGGPPVVSTSKPSYGTSTICDLIPYEFGGAADLVLAPEGVRCRVELPAEWLSNDSQPLSRSTTHANGHQEIDDLKQVALKALTRNAKSYPNEIKGPPARLRARRRKARAFPKNKSEHPENLLWRVPKAPRGAI